MIRQVRFLPRLPEADYLNVLALADVVLDTLHYGGGANTTYDALAVSTPIVTLPGQFHRGRWALAAYQRLGIDVGVADSAAMYVELALRLGMDGEYRDRVAARIQAASSVLFEDMKAVEELVGFFETAVGEG